MLKRLSVALLAIIAGITLAAMTIRWGGTSEITKRHYKHNLEQARCNYLILNSIRVDPLHEVEYFNCREYWYNQVDSLTKVYMSYGK